MVDLEKILQKLVRAEVDFVVIGGLAAVSYGTSLQTEDLDICCDFTPENLSRLQKALAGINPIHRMPPSRLPLQLTPELIHGLKNLYLKTDYGQLDCLGEVKGIGAFSKVKEQSVLIDLENVECRVLTLEALIKAKEAMTRPRDHQAVLELKAIRERLNEKS
jgi:hypothetical protein